MFDKINDQGTYITFLMIVHRYKVVSNLPWWLCKFGHRFGAYPQLEYDQRVTDHHEDKWHDEEQHEAVDAQNEATIVCSVVA